ncbi:MAG: protein-L-isoaspartate(D-aspartate) O-methyltransferase [Opitutales bacterium]|nr:protein-L-isoaspartate(D-aspartate) O-methyltransferase [Opitutales bacterium]
MKAEKKKMIEEHLKGRDINDPAVLRAMETVDRSLFVPENLRPYAYADRPLAIGHQQTISQPYIVAFMAQSLKLTSEDTVFEGGTGCGYNAAVLAQIAKTVYSVEVIPELVDTAKTNLGKTGITNIEIKQGDATQGWPQKAPFDAIILTAAPPSLPPILPEQLKVGGRLLAPLGNQTQNLVLFHKNEDGRLQEETLLPVRFVPMTGEGPCG